MGTNYDFFKNGESRHIGKSSGGWAFALHVYPEDGINDLEDWAALFPQGLIQNEYGESLSTEEMMEVITKRYWKRGFLHDGTFYRSEQDFHDKNHSQSGPNGLARSKVDGVFCIGHGEGTWDLMVGEFS